MKQNNQNRFQRGAAPLEGALRGISFCPISPGGGPVDAGEPLAMIYAPQQTFTDIYGDDEALARGTLFADLYFPFEACGGMMR